MPDQNSFHTGWPQRRPNLVIKIRQVYVHLDTKPDVNINGFSSYF
jgi:hypothetical protein